MSVTSYFFWHGCLSCRAHLFSPPLGTLTSNLAMHQGAKKGKEGSLGHVIRSCQVLSPASQWREGAPQSGGEGFCSQQSGTGDLRSEGDPLIQLGPPRGPRSNLLPLSVSAPETWESWSHAVRVFTVSPSSFPAHTKH